MKRMDVVAHRVPETLLGTAGMASLRAMIERWNVAPHAHRLAIFGLEETADGWAVLTAPEPRHALGAMLTAADRSAAAERIRWAVARVLELADAVATLGGVHGEIDRRSVGFLADGRAMLLPPFPRVILSHDATGRSTVSSVGLQWCPPEEITGAPRVPKGDVYQLVFLLRRLLGAPSPFAGMREVDTLNAKVKNAPLPSLRALGIDLPEALDAALARGVSPDVAQRFADAPALVEALTRFGGESAPFRERLAMDAAAHAKPRERDAVGALLEGPVDRPCPKAWAALSPTDRPDVRHCAECQLPVQRVRTVAALVPLRGSCVFFDPNR